MNEKVDIIQLQELSDMFNKLMEKIYMECDDSNSKDSELTIAQIKCLFVIDAIGSQKMSEIASKINITLSGATSLIDKLVKSELVKRDTDESDRRVVLIALTAKGKSVVDHHLQIRKDSFEKILNRIPKAKRHDLINAFSVIHTVLDEASASKEI